MSVYCVFIKSLKGKRDLLTIYCGLRGKITSCLGAGTGYRTDEISNFGSAGFRANLHCQVN